MTPLDYRTQEAAAKYEYDRGLISFIEMKNRIQEIQEREQLSREAC